MFYVKKTIGDTTEINIEINDENVFCRCPVCGREVLVDLEKVLATGRATCSAHPSCARTAHGK